jgi:hypothetical protein
VENYCIIVLDYAIVLDADAVNLCYLFYLLIYPELNQLGSMLELIKSLYSQYEPRNSNFIGKPVPYDK